MISYDRAKDIVIRSNRDRIIRASYRLSDGYLFLFVPKDLSTKEFFLGGYFKVTTTGQLQEYSPVFNPEEFKQALKNQLE